MAPLTPKELALLARYPNVAYAFARQCKASRDHSDLARDALAKYGDHGPGISGCVRHHFPECVKNELRALASAASSYEAYRLRPKGARRDTIRTIGRLVARRDGSGFYGP